MTIIFEFERDPFSHTTDAIPRSSSSVKVRFYDCTKLGCTIPCQNRFLTQVFPEILYGSRQCWWSTKHSTNIPGPSNILISQFVDLIGNILFIIPHHTHVNGRDSREEGQSTLTPTFPSPGCIETSTAEFDTCASREEGEKSESYPRSMMNWKSMENNILLGDTIEIPVRFSVSRQPGTALHGSFWWACCARGEYHSACTIHIEHSVWRYHNIICRSERGTKERLNWWYTRNMVVLFFGHELHNGFCEVFAGWTSD